MGSASQLLFLKHLGIASSEIKDIRGRLGVPQSVFAQLIGVSIETAKSWES